MNLTQRLALISPLLFACLGIAGATPVHAADRYLYFVNQEAPPGSMEADVSVFNLNVDPYYNQILEGSATLRCVFKPNAESQFEFRMGACAGGRIGMRAVLRHAGNETRAYQSWIDHKSAYLSVESMIESTIEITEQKLQWVGEPASGEPPQTRKISGPYFRSFKVMSATRYTQELSPMGSTPLPQMDRVRAASRDNSIDPASQTELTMNCRFSKLTTWEVCH